MGVVLIVHGFLGYKDYGMFPRIAQHLASSGFIAHRFNLSHSGMTNNIATFERPDLFQRDTWNTQVHDIDAVIEGVAAGALVGNGLPYVLLGHSRGGASVLLTAGRRFRRGRTTPAGLITLAAPSRTNNLDAGAQEALMRDGALPVRSNRTGQELLIGRQWMTEQLEDPEGHDLLGLAGACVCPMLIAHGETDPTVSKSCAEEIARAAGGPARALIIPGGDHVLNTPNPLADDAPSSPQLCAFLEAAAEHCHACCS